MLTEIRKIAATLRTMPLFENLRERELDLLAAVMQRTIHDAESTICREGEEADACFVVVRGAVEVRKTVRDGPDRVVATLGPNHVFGHIALIDPGPRNATCVATEETEIFVLDRSDFETLFLGGTHFAVSFQQTIATNIAAQMRAANQRLHALISESRRDEGGAAPPIHDHETLVEITMALARGDIAGP